MRLFLLIGICVSSAARLCGAEKTTISPEYAALGEWISDYREGYFSGALTRRQWAFQIERVLEKIEQELERVRPGDLQQKAPESRRMQAIVLSSKSQHNTRAIRRLAGIARDMKKSFGNLWKMDSDLNIVKWFVNNRLAIEGWTAEADRILKEDQPALIRTSAQYIIMILSDLKAVVQ